MSDHWNEDAPSDPSCSPKPFRKQLLIALAFLGTAAGICVYSCGNHKAVTAANKAQAKCHSPNAEF